MKPRELYSGQAPAAMAQMGQGMAEVGARIADIGLRGQEAMAKGISSGVTSAINAIADAYKEHKNMVAENKSAANMYQDLRDSNLLPESLTSRIDDQVSTKDGWYAKATPLERNKFWKDFDPYFKASIANQYAINRIEAETAGRIKSGESGAEAGLYADVVKGVIASGGVPKVLPGNSAFIPVMPSMSPGAARSLEDNRKRAEQRYRQNRFDSQVQ
jgi:uncharacterized protein YoaH (UPF0181 family)